MSLREKVFKQIMLHMPKGRAVLFNSFDGQYNDNPKYISEKLYQLDPTIEIIWVKSEKSKEKFPEYIKCVTLNSAEFIKYSFLCKVLVDNVIGFRLKSGKTKKILKRIFFLKSNRQLCISTWHGTPIKKIGRNSPEFDGINYFASCSDYLIAGCQYTKERLEDAFYPMQVKLTGTPRNDILVNGIDHVKEMKIREKLMIPQNKKVVLFAPTFRDGVEYSGLHQLQNFDIERILGIFNRKYGGEWVFVFRVHHAVLNKIDTLRLMAERKDIVINGNIGDDMAEYLAITDVLLTDYSGSIFDFALTQKPCFLYTPDQYHYINNERGTYVPLDYLPYPHTDDIEKLYCLMEECDLQKVQEATKQFNIKVGNTEMGNASMLIATQIVEFLRKK